MSDQTYVIEHRELNFTQLADLEVFLSNVSEVVSDIFRYDAKASQQRNWREEKMDVEISFEELKLIVGEIRGEIESGRFSITDTQIESIQSLYNDLTNTRSLLAEKYGELHSSPATPSNLLAKQPQKPTPSQTAKPADIESKKAAYKTQSQPKSPIKKNTKQSRSVKENHSPKDATKISKSHEQKKKRYIVDDSYQHYTNQKSPTKTTAATLEKYILAEADRFEASTLGALDRWLNEPRGSAYLFLKNRTVREIKNMGTSDSIRADLEAEQIKYETFVAWQDLMIDMQSQLEVSDNIALEEVFTRWLTTES